MSDKRKQPQSAKEAGNYSLLKTEQFQMILLCGVVFKVVYQQTY